MFASAIFSPMESVGLVLELICPHRKKKQSQEQEGINYRKRRVGYWDRHEWNSQSIDQPMLSTNGDSRIDSRVSKIWVCDHIYIPPAWTEGRDNLHEHGKHH